MSSRATKEIVGKEEADRVKLEAELELERQRSISEEAQKTRELEAEAMRLEVEVQAILKEDSIQESLEEQLKEFKEEADFHPLGNGADLATCRDPVTYTSTPKQCADNQQLKVKFSDQEVDTNGGLQADSTINRIVVRSCCRALFTKVEG